MKHKEPLALFWIGVLLSGIVTAGAAEAGSAADPLIALNWLKETFIPGAISQAGERVDQDLNELGDQLAHGAQNTELRVKHSDILWLESGSSLTPLAGSFTLSPQSQGTVIDLTDGTEPSTESETISGHRYLAAEASRIAFTVTSDTAVVLFGGPYTLESSAETDYNALADTLHQLGLFRGSDVPYGSGYDLESAPTRIQGLVMFLRLMGEEQAALSYPGSGITFADVPEWALPYVAYAYDKGYTKGQAVDDQWRVVFGSDQPLAARDHMTFLLRALDYPEGSRFSWESAIADGQTLGVLTEGEARQLTDHPFLRAQVAYLSCVALSSKTQGGEGAVLLESLAAAGAVDATNVDTVLESVVQQRM